MRIVDLTKEQIDEDNYAYAICECILAHEAIEIPRRDETMFIIFDCPRCGRELGIIARGKEDLINE